MIVGDKKNNLWQSNIEHTVADNYEIALNNKMNDDEIKSGIAK